MGRPRRAGAAPAWIGTLHAYRADAGTGFATEDRSALVACRLALDRLAEPAATP